MNNLININVLSNDYIRNVINGIETIEECEQMLEKVNKGIYNFEKEGFELSKDEIQTIDSREVAEMLSKRHSDVLEYIEGKYDKDGKVRIVGIIPTLENGGVRYQDYFIPHSYKSGTREYKCYLVTKMGCEMLGNKQQGEKGILFTARYVERFNQMEQMLKEQKRESYTFEDKRKRVNAWLREQEESEYKQFILLKATLEERIDKLKLKPMADKFTAFMDKDGTFGFRDLVKHLNGLGLNVKENEIREFLKEKSIICKQGSKYVISQKGVRDGYGLMRDNIVGEKNRPETRYTDKLRDMLLEVFKINN